MDDDISVRGLTIPGHELDWRFTGSGGPGGQHANTSNTAVELRLDVLGSPSIPDRLRDRLHRRLGDQLTKAGELIVTSSEHRSQHRNRVDARRRMKDVLDAALAPPAKKRRPTRPSRASQRRRVEDKRRRGRLKASRRGDDWG